MEKEMRMKIKKRPLAFALAAAVALAAAGCIIEFDPGNIEVLPGWRNVAGELVDGEGTGTGDSSGHDGGGGTMTVRVRLADGVITEVEIMSHSDTQDWINDINATAVPLAITSNGFDIPIDVIADSTFSLTAFRTAGWGALEDAGAVDIPYP
jgi:uncharacterized protein with FMN-binding domain